MSQKKPNHDPEKFPAGSAKIGDAALVVINRRAGARILNRKTWQCHLLDIRPATVVNVGFANAYGYHLDVEVKFAGTTKTKIFTPVSNVPAAVTGGKRQSALLVLCPADEQPEELQNWARKNKVIVVRNPQTSPPQLGLLCGNCLGELVRMSTTEESQSLRWWGEGFSLGKPYIIDGHEKFCCEDCLQECQAPDSLDDYT